MSSSLDNYVHGLSGVRSFKFQKKHKSGCFACSWAGGLGMGSGYIASSDSHLRFPFQESRVSKTFIFFSFFLSFNSGHAQKPQSNVCSSNRDDTSNPTKNPHVHHHSQQTELRCLSFMWLHFCLLQTTHTRVPTNLITPGSKAVLVCVSILYCTKEK